MSKILIVEDEEAIADLEKDYLELNDFEVKIENSGDTGLATALAEDFDLIILDLMLPGIDGFEIFLFLWYLPRRMILTRSEVLDWEQMIT